MKQMDQWGLNTFMTQRFLLQRTIFMSPVVPRIIGNQTFPPFPPHPRTPAIYLNNLKGEQGSISRRGVMEANILVQNLAS